MRYVSERNLRKWIITDGCEPGHGYIDEDDLNSMEWETNIVHTEVLDQIMWERDIAIAQLKELGYSLGEKLRTDGDTISRETTKRLYKQELENNLKNPDRNIDFSEFVEEPYKLFCDFIDKVPDAKDNHGEKE